MPIDFVCSCGKYMKAKDAFAGRKIRCPQCGTLVRIPKVEHFTAAHLPPVPQPVATGDGLTADMAPAEAPLARKVVARLAPAVIDMPDEASVHAWIDRSLAQQSTPWKAGDEERFQAGVKAPREGWSFLEKVIVGFLLVVGIAVIAWLLFLQPGPSAQTGIRS